LFLFAHHAHAIALQLTFFKTFNFVHAVSQTIQRKIGYWGSWSVYRSCHRVEAKDLDVQSYTDIIFSFAVVTAAFELDMAVQDEIKLLTDLQTKKKENPNLRTSIAVGGFTFNDPPTGTYFVAFTAIPT
jgi:GH18 family chitinase